MTDKMKNNGSEKIRVTKNGPYMVEGNVKLNQAIIEQDDEGNSISWGEGKTYETSEKYALCRCGRSKTKPFCDGAHAKTGWEGEETASHDLYADSCKVYTGGTIDMMDREELCAVARFCDVVNAWQAAMQSSDEHPELEEIATREACDCPSGRLTVRKNGVEIEYDLPKEISLVQDLYYDVKGPLYVKGGITLIGEDGTEYEIRNRRTLCRCGESQNLPFCDAAHLRSENMKGLDE